MKKIFLSLAAFSCFAAANAQNPGLIISEYMANPNGSDLAKEWVELVATRAIDFSAEPFCVVVSNNGTATSAGWIAGGTLTYGFNITSGTVATGDVVYVGGTGMTPVGPRVRQIDVTTTGGDGFGTLQATAGVFGNGGSNADGIAVFSGLTTSLTNASVPVDAIMYGTAIGSAVVSGGTAGYQLPVNDRYAGGKLQTTSYFAGDPGADQTTKATGYFNTTTNQWFGTRSWTLQAYGTDHATDIQLITADPPGTAAITTTFQEVNENAGTINVAVTFASANSSPAKIRFNVSVHSDAQQGSDYTIASDTLTIPAGSNGTFQFPIQLNDDALAERSERLIVKMTGAVNASLTTDNYQVITIRDNDYAAPVSSNELQLQLLTSFSNGAEGTNSAEIVSYDSLSHRLFIANSVGAKLDIVDFSNPAAPSLVSSVNISTYGNLNSIVAHNGLVVAAVENSNPQADGFLVFFDQNGTYLNQVTVGAMPDMVTFNHDFTKVLTACEGEPNAAYTTDPVGSVGIVDISGGIASLTQSNVSMANFNAYVGQEAALRAQGVRIFGPGSTAAQDFEPEYITVSDDNSTAYVSLQENNAMAVVDIASATVTAIRPLGYIDYSNGTNGLDASDQSAGIYIAGGPFRGMYMPDAIAHATIGGTEYIFSANEGDSREYAGFSEVTRLSGATLDASIPDQAILKQNKLFGRLNITTATGDTDGDGDLDEIYVYGGRSFSIWNAATGALVFNSSDLIEQITSHDPSFAALFNASNTSGAAVQKNRSDDKGPEPEGVATAVINGNHYLFVSMERIGGVMAFNIDNPLNPVYSGYYNNRTAATNGPDRGAEGIIFIPADQSPNGHQLMILANEVSSTLSIYQINTCVELAGGVISTSDAEICAGESTTLTVGGASGTTVQWLKDDAVIAGQTGTSLNVTTAGDYRVYVSSSTLACADTSEAQTIVVHALPAIAAGADQAICAGTGVTLAASSAAIITWNNSVQDGIAFTPASTASYIATATDGNGCSNSDTLTVTVHILPTVSAGSDQAVCEETAVTLAGTGATSYSWNNSVTDGVAFIPAATQTYIVTGTDANGCENNDTVTVTVNALPAVSAGTDPSICEGTDVTLTATGGATYSWNNGVMNGVAFTPVSTTDYIVTGTGANGCENSDTVTVTVNALPAVSAGTDQSACEGADVTLNASGASTYSWNNGVTNGVAFAPATTIDYAVTGTDANGCENSDTVTVSINALPTVNAGTDQEICAGTSVTLAATGAVTYSWSNSVQNGVAFTPASTASYTVTGTDANGCEDTDEVTVTVNALPVVSAGQDATVCQSQLPYTFTATAGFTSYAWNGTTGTNTYSANAAGTYTVTATDANSCTGSDAVTLTVDPCLGLAENAQLTISIHPNPTNGIFTIVSDDNSDLQVEIFGTDGKSLFTTAAPTVDLTAAAPGTYLVKITQNGITALKRVQKF